MFKRQSYYKLQWSQNIFRQVLFTDKNIIISLIVINWMIFLFGFKQLEFEFRFFTALIISGIIVLISQIEIDDQKLYEIIPRYLISLFKGKDYRIENDKQNNLINYNIRNSLLYTPNSVVVIFKLDPIDLSIKSPEEQYAYFSRLVKIFVLLKGEIQLNLLFKAITVNDLNPFFASLIKSNVENENKSVEKQEFINRSIRELGEKVKDNNSKILNKTLYLQIKENCRTNNPKEITKAVEKLREKTKRMTGAFTNAGIRVRQLISDDEIKEYIEQYY